jgi:hypothetical protein
MADPRITLDANDARFLAARLRRLFAHFGIPVPNADDDAHLIGNAGAAIGMLLTRRETEDAAARSLQAASQAQQPAQQSDLPRKPDSLPVVLNMLRETKGGNECRLPTPACWDLAQYVTSLEAALLAAIGKLVSSTQPAMSQDAQPVAWLWTNPDGSKECSFVQPEQDPDMSTMLALELGREATPLYTHPPIPQEVMEALEDAMRWLAAFAYGQKALSEVQASPRWGKYTQALAILRSQVQGGLSTNNEEMK